MSLKTILDDVQLECGLGTSSEYANSSDEQNLRVVALANRALNDIMEYPWQALRRQYLFTLTTATSYDLPDDYKAFVPNTMYVSGRYYPVNFPASDSTWAYLKAGSAINGIRYNIRLLNDSIQVHQPNSGQEVKFEYYRNVCVTRTDEGVVSEKSKFTHDDDEWLLDEELLKQNIIWRQKKLLGYQDWKYDRAEYDRYFALVKGRERGTQSINMNEQPVTFGEPYYELWRP